MYEHILMFIAMILITFIGLMIYHSTFAMNRYDYNPNIQYINDRLAALFLEDQPYPYDPPPLPN